MCFDVANRSYVICNLACQGTLSSPCCHSYHWLAYEFCTACHCLENQTPIAEQPCLDIYKGDGFCDDINNNFGCDYDGGDCCGESFNSKYCMACQCLQSGCKWSLMNNSKCDPENDNEACSFDGGDCLKEVIWDCEVPHYAGDDFCDDENNEESCNFDGGDCCTPFMEPNWNSFCTDCTCLSQSMSLKNILLLFDYLHLSFLAHFNVYRPDMFIKFVL